jgi:DNA-binding PadR family transcriptional regulator
MGFRQAYPGFPVFSEESLFRREFSSWGEPLGRVPKLDFRKEIEKYPKNTLSQSCLLLLYSYPIYSYPIQKDRTSHMEQKPIDAELTKGTLSLLILSLLKRRAMYGYELAATVKQETGGAFEWRAGSLYPSLHKLEKDGLVQAEWQGRPEGRQRKYYHLTESGEDALAEKVKAWSSLSQAVNQVLENSHE